ncbi:hypothetical protein [Shewanella sp. NIFS-20-20]|uniref:hypothetical protein n=1 Tax=Shewanella sp. NIFS-20-20 TaxID=2853806 RepID=UPI001C45663C|nr:hypothetical protein [Shewanella sp. NIFS-20-20]MBV7314753.1 hypothetical protein [Shewanella sp. NIFS-20-20]
MNIDNPDDIDGYGWDLYHVFVDELISGGCPDHSLLLTNLTNLLSMWKATDDPGYLDILLLNAVQYRLSLGRAITWELAKAANIRLSGKTAERSGIKAQAAKVYIIRVNACSWIYRLRTYCGMNADDAKHKAAARLYEENKNSDIKVEMKPDTLGKLYNLLYPEVRIEKMKNNPIDLEWAKNNAEAFESEFTHVLPVHLEPNSRD